MKDRKKVQKHWKERREPVVIDIKGKERKETSFKGTEG